MSAAPQTFPLLGGETVTQLSSAVTGTDSRGNDVRETTSAEVSGCAFVPGTTAENIQGTAQVTADAELYMPAGSVVTAEDQFIRQGVTYRVMGAPESWTSPFTGIPGPVKVVLRVVTGAGGHVGSPVNA